MSKRSVWCNVSKEERKLILLRDNNRCIVCGSKKPLTMAHIFLSRSQGGKGSRKNIVSLCTNCHYYTLDNPLGTANYIKGQKMLQYCKNYLIEKENINYDKDFIESLKYKKNTVSFDTNINLEKKYQKKCKDCYFLIKTNNNSSIQIYFCKYKKMRKGKNTDACNKFKDAI